MKSPSPIVLASANPDKAAEIQEILGSHFTLIPRPSSVPDVVEDGATLVENARLKAVALVSATGLPAIADDTGFEVDALGGAPGIHAARYAGEGASYQDNLDKLLAELVEVPAALRTARFRTIALYRSVSGDELVAEGVVEGFVLSSPRPGGWGYDPVFVPIEGNGRAFSEMTSSEKHAISHRGRAFRALRVSLTDAGIDC